MSDIDEVFAKFDAVVNVRFLTRAEGGRKDAVKPPSGFFPCTLVGMHDNTGVDARIVFAGLPAELGQTYKLPVVFLSPDLAVERFPAGSEFRVLDGRKVTGHGVFLSYRSDLVRVGAVA